MTKEEWEACDESQVMLTHVEHYSDRKLRLFTCACCRRVWSKINDERCRAAVEGSEQFADDLISQTALASLSDSAAEAYGEAFRSTHASANIVGLYAAHLVTVETIEDWHLSDIVRATADATRYADNESTAQADLLREMFGNPFQPIAFNPAWRPTDVKLLAVGIYVEKAFDRLPILADVLQDAGCDSEPLLDHLRDETATHVRGCWALDLVLGKE